MRYKAQSLLELALVAPVLIVLAMAAWDGGSVLREQLVLQTAARDGARVAATAYGAAVPTSVVANAVLASARDLPGLSSTPGYLAITYPDPQSVQVRLTYGHALITPVLRQLWSGGQGTLTLYASATFYVPQLTPVPATLVPATPTLSSGPTPSPTPTSTPSPVPTSTPSPVPTSTPSPTPTSTPSPVPSPTPSPTPTLTPTPTPTPTPPPPCDLDPASQSVPALVGNAGYWCTLEVTVSSLISAGWQDNNDSRNQVLVYAGNPFSGQADPTIGPPPAGNLAGLTRTDNELWAATPGCQPPGTYTVLFFNGGVPMTSATLATVVPDDCADPG